MKTVTINEFTRHYTRYKHLQCLVTHRGKVVGEWTPAPRAPQPVDFEARVKTMFTRKLPFTGAQLLKEGKKR